MTTPLGDAHARTARGPARHRRAHDPRDRHHGHARPRRHRARPRSTPASASTTTCSARSAHHGLFDLDDRARRRPRRSTSTTRSRTSRSCSAPRSPRRSATGPGSAASATRRCPMDESLATAVVDVGGRPYAVIDLPFRGERVGAPAAPARRARPRVVRPDRRARRSTCAARGRNDHHLAEAAFKALGRALRRRLRARSAARPASPRRRASLG